MGLSPEAHKKIFGDNGIEATIDNKARKEKEINDYKELAKTYIDEMSEMLETDDYGKNNEELIKLGEKVLDYYGSVENVTMEAFNKIPHDPARFLAMMMAIEKKRQSNAE